MRREIEELRRRLIKLNKQLNGIQKELGRQEARCELLDQTRMKGVKMPNGESVFQLIGRFASLINIPAEVQPIIATALENRLATLLVAEVDDVWALLTVNKQPLAVAALPDVRPIVLPAFTEFVSAQDAGNYQWARQVVSVQAGAEQLADLLLGHIILADSPHSAYDIAQKMPAGSFAIGPQRLYRP